MLTVYATLTGTNRQQLSVRLSWLARQYARYTVTKPGRPARLDAFSEEAQFVADALVNAARILVDDNAVARRAELVHAVRRAEDRWQKVQVDLHRAGTTWADLRPRLTYQQDLPTQRTAGSTPRRHLTLVPDRPTAETTRLAETRAEQARPTRVRPGELGSTAVHTAERTAMGRCGTDGRMVEKVTTSAASHRRELTRPR
jgi:hypothetical protein